MSARPRHTRLLLILLSLAVRLGWCGYQSWSDGAHLTYDDERLHWQLAVNLVQTGTLVTDDGRLAARMPLYPLFLAGFAGAGANGILAARFAQALIGTLVVATGIHVCLRYFGERAALLGGLLLCFDPFAIFFCALLLNETLFAAALALFTAQLLAMAALPAPRWLHAVVLGVTAAGLVMLRPEALGLWLLAAPALLLARGLSRAHRHENASRPRLLPAVGTLAIATFVILAAMFAWGWRNHGVLDAWVFLSCNGGVTLYDGQGPQADGSSRQDFMQTLPELAELGEVERDRQLSKLAWEQMQNDPGRTARLAVVKLARTWGLTPNVESHRGGFTASLSLSYMLVLYGLLAVSIARLRGALARLWPLWLPVVFSLIVTSIYIGSVRYRIPYMPLLEILSSAAVHRQLRPATPGPDMIHHDV